MEEKINYLFITLLTWSALVFFAFLEVKFPHYRMHNYTTDIEENLARCKIHSKEDIERHRKKSQKLLSRLLKYGPIVCIIIIVIVFIFG